MTVIEGPFDKQVVHVDDGDGAPLCGADADGAFVADGESRVPVTSTWRWCNRCLRRKLAVDELNRVHDLIAAMAIWEAFIERHSLGAPSDTRRRTHAVRLRRIVGTARKLLNTAVQNLLTTR